MFDISKIKQYNLARLAYIVFYKVLYNIYLRVFLFFTPGNWSEKKGVRGDDEQRYSLFFSLCDSNIEQIIDEANLILSGKIELFGLNYDIDPEYGWLTDPVSKKQWSSNAYFVSAPVKQKDLGDVKYVLELNKFNHLVRVALAYYFSKEDKYVDYIITAIEGYRKTVKPYRSVCQRIIMDMGFRIINLIQLMMLCSGSEKFEKDCAPLINGVIYDQVNAIRRFHTAKWFKTGNGNNHVTGEMIGAITGTLWLEYNQINVRRCYGQYMQNLVEVLNRTIAPSGAYLEQSDNYARVVAEFLLFFEMISRTIPSKSLSLTEYNKHCYTKRLIQYLTDINYHDQLPNFGDNDDARVLLAWKPKGETISYILKDCSINNQSYLDGSTWVYRSEDKNDIYLFTRVGAFAYYKEATRIHSHNDLLSLVMGVKGQLVFVDKGCYLYNQGADILRVDRSYASHNTASINNIEIDDIQNNGSFLDYPDSRCVLTDTNDSHCRFVGTLEYYGVKQRRAIEYAKNVITIVDTFEGDELAGKQGKVRFIIHKDLRATLNNNVVTITSANVSDIKLEIAFEGIDSVKLDKESYSPAFAREEETIAIEGFMHVNDGKEVITKILIK